MALWNPDSLCCTTLGTLLLFVLCGGKESLGQPENGNRNLSMACFELRAFHGYIRDMVKHPASKYGVHVGHQKFGFVS